MGIGSMKMNETVTVKYIGEDDPLALRAGKVYSARVLKKGWYGVVDETGEEYAYPPDLYEVIEGIEHDAFCTVLFLCPK